jgi:hypothetical protein
VPNREVTFEIGWINGAPPDARHYRAAFAFSSLPYPLPQTAHRAVTPAGIRRGIGLIPFCLHDTNELVPAFNTGNQNVRVLQVSDGSNRLRAFWLEPVSVLGSADLTLPVAGHLCWTYHSALSSHHVDAGNGENFLADAFVSEDRSMLSRAFDLAVTSHADRLLRTEPQVRLTNLQLFSMQSVSNHRANNFGARVDTIPKPSA